MIEHMHVARAHAPPPIRPAPWTRPPLPRGRAPLARALARLAIRVGLRKPDPRCRGGIC